MEVAMDRPLLLWFHSGTRVFLGERDAELYPPLGDIRAHRHWVVGFAMAWMSSPWSDCVSSAPVPSDALRSLEDALRNALDGRPELLQRLLPHGGARYEGVLH